MNRRPIDFDKLVNQVRKPTVGQEHLSIWGGTCPEDALTDFLAGWPLEKIPYRIWESTDRIDFERDSSAPNVALLEHGRLFGPGGDLDLRRDGDVFHWRFVGVPNVHPPEGYDAEENNFWQCYQDAKFHCYKETTLLWGRQNDETWHDDRVAAAKLDYPAPNGTERVQVEYRVYSRAGRVEFVWLTGLSKWKEKNDA